MWSRPPRVGGLDRFWGPEHSGEPVACSHRYPARVRPGTAIILIVLLLAIAVAGVIQLWEILFPPG